MREPFRGEDAGDLTRGPLNSALTTRDVRSVRKHVVVLKVVAVVGHL